MQSACKMVQVVPLVLLSTVFLGGCDPAKTNHTSSSRQSPTTASSDKKESPSANPKKKASPPAPASPKLVKLDLPVEKVITAPTTIEVPEGTAAKDNVIEVDIEGKPPFLLEIRQKEGELSKRVKGDLGGDKDVKYLIDTADTKFIETEIFGKKAWKFWTEVKVGDTTYQVKGGLQPATREEVEFQLKCAKTLAPKK